MFGFQKKKTEVLSHWYVLIEAFQYSAGVFYTEIEEELSKRQLPGLAISRVDFSEGGLLSDKRTYLRMLRERLVFDVCAAPFGTAYFFSVRYSAIPPLIKPWELLVFFVGLGFILDIFIAVMGVILGIVGLIAFIAVGIWYFRNLVALGLSDIDASLIQTPVLGSIYERFLRKETYYREDTRLMYHTMVSELVKKKVEEVTAAKGVRYLETYEQSPILGQLYKQNRVTLKTEESETVDVAH